MNDWSGSPVLAVIALLWFIPLCIWASNCGAPERERVREACVWRCGNPDCEPCTCEQNKAPPPK